MDLTGLNNWNGQSSRLTGRYRRCPLSRISPLKRLVRCMKNLQNHPRPAGVKTLAAEDRLYRIREGDYRIIYTIQDKELIVLALKIGNRKEIYR